MRLFEGVQGNRVEIDPQLLPKFLVRLIAQSRQSGGFLFRHLGTDVVEEGRQSKRREGGSGRGECDLNVGREGAFAAAAAAMLLGPGSRGDCKHHNKQMSPVVAASSAPREMRKVSTRHA